MSSGLDTRRLVGFTFLMTAAAKTRSRRPKCRHCGCPAAKGNPLRNGYDTDACATAAILNRR